jgi:hypothetical protein
MSKAALRSKRRRARMTPAQRRAESARKAASAARLREALILKLAPDLRCARCGEQAAHSSLLQVDHVDGKSWTARKLSSTARVARYRREHRAGVPLRALCSDCNATDGGFRRYGVVDADEVPF